MSAKSRTDRCVNPFKKLGEKEHCGKDLRMIPKFIRDKFPEISTNSKICSACRKKSRTEYVDMSLDESNDCVTNMECDGSSLMDIDNSEISYNEDNIRSPREIELEEMLDGLKQKFSTLKHNDPLRVRILI